MGSSPWYGGLLAANVLAVGCTCSTLALDELWHQVGSCVDAVGGNALGDLDSKTAVPAGGHSALGSHQNVATSSPGF